jgi:hypothetical protein
MSRLSQLKSLSIAALATLGLVLACRATTPGEAPPMGPRPGPVQPVANPVPGSPDPLSPRSPNPSKPSPDAQPAPNPAVTMREVPSPDYRAAGTPAQTPPDAGADATSSSDAAVLPDAIPDSMPTDAAKTLQP